MAFPWAANGENPIRGLILCANSISQAKVIRGHIKALSLWLAGADRQRLTPEGSQTNTTPIHWGLTATPRTVIHLRNRVSQYMSTILCDPWYLTSWHWDGRRSWPSLYLWLQRVSKTHSSKLRVSQSTHVWRWGKTKGKKLKKLQDTAQATKCNHDILRGIKLPIFLWQNTTVLSVLINVLFWSI